MMVGLEISGEKSGRYICGDRSSNLLLVDIHVDFRRRRQRSAAQEIAEAIDTRSSSCGGRGTG